MVHSNPAAVACPGCAARYPWRDELAGRKVLCRCGLKMRMPADPAGKPTILSPPQSSPRPLDEYVLEQIAPSATRPPAPTGPASVCPSCDRTLEPGAVICIPCGINIRSGRPVFTSEKKDAQVLEFRARGTIWWLSWLAPIGLFPIASEAHGAFRPLAIRSLAIVTIIITVWYWAYDWTGSPRMHVLKNQMLWAGHGEPDAEMIEMLYEITSWGDRSAYLAKKSELRGTISGPQLAVAAVRELPPSQQCFGQFHLWQLFTHAFLHGDPLHLAGNLLFLIIFGCRINALIGNVGSLVVYPILGVAAALPQIVSMADGPPTPSLGASGAIMGLAGMYLVLFPVNNVHVAVWARTIFTALIIKMKFFQCRGFWVLLFYIGWDVLWVSLGVDGGVAHWAHIGGFLAGMLIAVALLLARAVNSRGADLLSLTLGRHAWAILGKPSQWQQPGREDGWLQRARLIPAEVWTQFNETFRPRATPSR